MQRFYLLKVASVSKSPVTSVIFIDTQTELPSEEQVVGVKCLHKICEVHTKWNKLWLIAQSSSRMIDKEHNGSDGEEKKPTDAAVLLHTPANMTSGSVISLLSRACSKTSRRETNFRLCVFLFTKLWRNMFTQKKRLAERIRYSTMI